MICLQNKEVKLYLLILNTISHSFGMIIHWPQPSQLSAKVYLLTDIKQKIYQNT